jgi:hypothetical protein
LAALRWLEDHAPVDTLNVQAYAKGQFPEEDPQWDPNYQKLPVASVVSRGIIRRYERRRKKGDIYE